MATAVFRHDADRIERPANGALVAGSVTVLGEVIGINTQVIAAGEIGTYAIKGVFEIAKVDSVDAFTLGAQVFWDVADGECNADNANPLAGICVKAAGATDTTVWVAINETTFIPA